LPFAFLFLFFSRSFWLWEFWPLLKDINAVLPPSANSFARMPPVLQFVGTDPILVRNGIVKKNNGCTASAPGLVVIRAQTGATMGPAFITIMLTRPAIIKTRSAAADTSMIPG